MSSAWPRCSAPRAETALRYEVLLGRSTRFTPCTPKAGVRSPGSDGHARTHARATDRTLARAFDCPARRGRARGVAAMKLVQLHERLVLALVAPLLLLIGSQWDLCRCRHAGSSSSVRARSCCVRDESPEQSSRTGGDPRGPRACGPAERCGCPSLRAPAPDIASTVSGSQERSTFEPLPAFSQPSGPPCAARHIRERALSCATPYLVCGSPPRFILHCAMLC